MVEIVTFGCRLNALESEAIRDAAAATAGDPIVLNTCAVTAEAVRQARQAIRRARRTEPDRRIVVTGCAAQIDPNAFAAMPEVDLVLGNAEKLAPTAYRDNRTKVGDIMRTGRADAPRLTRMTNRARAFVQIQNGCDHRCTFCVIPFGRGNSRSIPPAEVVAQVRRLAAAGHLEVVLTGVDLTAYGTDLEDDIRLGTLVRRILADVPELHRLRLSSVDSIEIDHALLAALAEEERLMPHVHLSLQAGDDMILKRMKRRHSRDDAIRLCTELRRLRPGIVFGADIIAGFPTETEDMFQASLDIVAECDLTHLHVFPFSPRPGTPAARMPQLDRAVVKERAARLRAAGDAAMAERLRAETGALRDVLVERDGSGRTEQFLPATVGASYAGRLVHARIVGAANGNLLAKALAEVA